MRAIVENVSRRGFIDCAAANSGLVVGMQLLPPGYAASPMAPAIDLPDFNPTTFLAIDTTGLVTIEARLSEMGAAFLARLLMAVADELEADWSRVCGSQAVADKAASGAHNTRGCRRIRHLLQPLRQMGAAARHMLETAAAALWGVDVSQVYARHHRIIHTSTGRVFGYGEVAAVARALSVPRLETLRLKTRRDFRYIGEGLRILDLADIRTRMDPPRHPARSG
jgi:isoquinoline 1-oxidoreductase beta subunit